LRKKPGEALRTSEKRYRDLFKGTDKISDAIDANDELDKLTAGGDFTMPLDLRRIDSERLYTLKEVSELLKLSYGTILSLKDKGSVDSIKIGAKYYMQGKDILTSIEKRNPL
jgi:hypothetical protein